MAPKNIPPTVPTGPSSGGNHVVAGVRSNDWFSPFQPLTPMAPGNVSGRLRDYRTGYNLDLAPRADHAVSFEQLRALAQNCDILRLVIETRKDQLAAFDWKIKRKDLGTKDAKAQKDAKDDPVAEKLEKFFKQPSRDYDFDEWLRAILEDLLVLDAVAIYKWRTNGGKLYSLDPLDATTIKVLIDSSGRRPVAPSPAYQQILKGIQAVDYMRENDPEFEASRILADPDGIGQEEITTDTFGLDELIYKARNVRTWSSYGYSPVEQIIMTVNTAIRRSMHQLAYYTDGNQASALVGLPAEWTPDQVASFQVYWDSINQGNLQERAKVRFLAGDPKISNFIDPDQKNDYDEWLARVICYCFSLPPTPFIKQMNRATAESSQQVATEEGLLPLRRWVKTFIDKVIVNDLDEPDYEFAWQDDSEVDVEAEANAAKTYVSIGVLDQNEVREDLGKDPRPEAGKLGVITAMGFTPLQVDDGTGGTVSSGSVPPGNADAVGDSGTMGQHPAAPNGSMNPHQHSPNAPGQPQNTPAKAPPETAAPGAKVEKAAAGGLKKKPTGPSLNSNAAVHARANITGKVEHLFQKAKARVQQQLRHDLHVISKAAGDNISTNYPINFDLSALAGIGAAVQEDLAAVAMAAGEVTVGTLNISTGYNTLFNKLNDRAADWSANRSAELVTMISDTTRRDLNTLISNALAANKSQQQIADELDGWNGFSDTRAELIARTEVGNASGGGSLQGLFSARDIGVKVKKEWVVNGESCDICQGNAEDGPIDLDDQFSSGDDAPLAHPNCECAMIGIVDEDD